MLTWIKEHKFAISLGLNIVLLGSGFWGFGSARDARRIAREFESSAAESELALAAAREHTAVVESTNRKLAELAERGQQRNKALEERLASIENRQQRIDGIIESAGSGIDTALSGTREIADLLAGAERTVFELQTINQ